MTSRGIGRRTALVVSLLVLCVTGGASSASGANGASAPSTICPQIASNGEPLTDKRTDATATCYYLPEIVFTPSSGTVAVNQTFTFNLEVWYSEYGCSKSGSWSGNLVTDSAGHFGPQSFTVGPFTSTGTYSFGVSCGGLGGTGVGNTSVTVVSAGGGDPGSGGGSSCTENLTSQIHATFMSMSGVPSTINAGTSFTAYVTFKNTGACTWTAANGYRLGSQNPENNATWGANRAYLSATDAIAPNQSKTFTINAVAPSTAGMYGWGWRMVREGINWLGTPTNASFTSISVSGSVPPQPTPPTVTLTAKAAAVWSDELPATLTWSTTNATSCRIDSSPTAGGTWSNLAGSGTVTPSPPVGDYTYTATCTGGGGSASAILKLSVVDANQLRLGSTVTSTTSTLSFDAVTKVRCKSHYLQNEGYNWITHQVKIRVWQDSHWCFNTKTNLLASGTQAQPLYRTFGRSDPGFPWSWDSWEGSCGAGDCTDYTPIGAASANLWMTGHIHSCINVPFVGQVACKNKSLLVRTIVRGDGTFTDDAPAP